MSYNYWCDKVFENNCTFGIVKTAHKSKLGDVQKMSYQMINTLEMDIMPNVVKRSKDYIELLKKDDNVFLQYLKDNVNFSNDYLLFLNTFIINIALLLGFLLCLLNPFFSINSAECIIILTVK